MLIIVNIAIMLFCWITVYGVTKQNNTLQADNKILTQKVNFQEELIDNQASSIREYQGYVPLLLRIQTDFEDIHSMYIWAIAGKKKRINDIAKWNIKLIDNLNLKK